MCGIAGLLDVRRSTPAPVLLATARRMAGSLTHRGPDDEGSWVDPEAGVALGHRRLSVVDLSAHGHQPMTGPGGRWVLTYNGEIYNHRALRARLASAGTEFLGTSDSEVLVAAISRWGLVPALEACEGMFALAAWDRRERQLHLARDRFGEKPLFFGWIGDHLAFASELKALHAHGGFHPSLDRQAVASFLRLSYVPAPRSIYQGVHKVGPGELVVVGPDDRPGATLGRSRYWSVGDAVARAKRHRRAGGPDAVVEEAEAVIDAAVSARMEADVPVGAFLSGGIDSSLVVALMRRHSAHPVRTFTIGMDDRGFDESPDARAVAAHLGTDHTAMVVTEADALAVIPALARMWDEPFADVSQIPTFLVSQLARQAVTVSLSGDGGDELFAGYNRHAWLERLWRTAGRLPRPARRAAGGALRAFPPGVWGSVPGGRLRIPANKVRKLGLVLAAEDAGDAYQALVSLWQEPEELVAGLTGPADYAGHAGFVAGDATELMLWEDLTGYLPDDILTKVDRASMAVSLESRIPFLDRQVLDLAWGLPLEYKLRQGTTKWVLRQILDRHVPRHLVDRPKMGFDIPIGAWLRGPLRPWAEDLLGRRALEERGLLRAGPVRAAWDDHVRGRQDRGYELWNVLMLQSWLAEWAGAGSAAAPGPGAGPPVVT